MFIPPAPNKPPLKGNCCYRVNNNNNYYYYGKKERDKGNWSQTAFDWSQSRTITIAAAFGAESGSSLPDGINWTEAGC